MSRGAASQWFSIRDEAAPLDLNGPLGNPNDQPQFDFSEQPIFSLFEAVALRQPQAVSLVHAGGCLTYAQLRRRARSLAARIAMEVPPGKAVAVLLPNAPESIVSVLACLCAGRTCLVLDAHHPVERNAEILRNSGVHVVVLRDHEDRSAACVPSGVGCIDLAKLPELEADTKTPPARAMGPGEPAIVLYTSGSTGRPKGIVLSQRTILVRVRNNIVSLRLDAEDRFLSLGALGTTAGLVGSLAALLSGAAQYPTSVAQTGASSLLSLIQQERITMLWGVPPLLRMLFEGDDASASLSTLRAIRTFGEPLLMEDAARWRALLPPTCFLAITYGQTEATIAQWFVPRGFISEMPAVPSGYLLREHEYAIIDEAGCGVSAGEVGELVLRSRYTALGEWENGGCTAGRIDPDPADPEYRILPTGDLVRLRCDGLLQVVGRRDRQIKISGHRLEPAEIETVVRRVPGVADAAIVARRDGEDTTLIAAIVASDPSDASVVHRVRSAARQSLPGYMQPARIVVAGRLPRLPGGKIDIEAVLALDTPALEGDCDSEFASTGTPPASVHSRQVVARAWIRTLGHKSLDAELTFEQAGGDSLKLLVLIFRIEEQLGTTVPLDLVHGQLRPSDVALALDHWLDGAPAPHQADDVVVFVFPSLGGRDTPGLARFRALCAPGLRMEVLQFGDWPKWAQKDFDFDALISDLVKQIEARAPTGPLLLAGHSLAGHFAYAAALALVDAGRMVAFVGLLDTGFLADSAMPGLARRIGLVSASISTQGFGPVMREGICRRIVRSRGLLRVMARFRHCPLPGDLGFHLHRYLRVNVLRNLCQDWWRAQTRTPRLLGAAVFLFRAREHPEVVSEDLGWRKVCSDLTVLPVTGGHISMLDPANVKSLARLFTATALQAHEKARADEPPAFNPQRRVLAD